MAVTMQGFAKREHTLNAPTTFTNADVGTVCALDTSAANTVKAAADGDVILGLVEQVEDLRSQAQGVLATVAFEFGARVAYDGTLAVGDYVVAAGSGKVRKVKTGGDSSNDTIPAGVVLPRVFEVDTTGKTAVIVK